MVKIMGNAVELKVPVNGEYVSVVRLLVSGLGARLGLPISEIENLKLVIGEAFLEIVSKCEQAIGLISFKWREEEQHITVSISDPSGMHKNVMNAASLALLKTMGGNYDTSVVDGIEHLDIDFTIKYQEDRPFLFHGKKDGQA